MPDHDEPKLYLMAGIDELQLEEGGKVYRPGDPMPSNLSHAKRASLLAAGVRFETRHTEPVLMPDGKPAEMAAANQIDPPSGGPAVIASVEDAPTAPDPPAGEPAPSPRRAARRDSD